MIKVSRASLWVAVVLSGALLHTAVAQTPATLEGRWRLVWNSYGEGQKNLAGRTRPVFLEIGPGPAGIDVRTWSDGDPATASSWPRVCSSWLTVSWSTAWSRATREIMASRILLWGRW